MHNLKHKILDKIFQTIGRAADEMGLECYLIGGYVRDILLDRQSKDIDVVVVGNGIDFAQKLAKTLGKGAFLSVFKTYGTAQVKHKGVEIEIVGARKESYNRNSRNPVVETGTLEDDQKRRDFTINALAICLNISRFGDVLDPFDGIADLQKKIIQTPLNPDITFSDDPLRMLRAIRFSSQLDFRIADETLAAITRNALRLEIITAERITDELNKILLSTKPSVGFFLLDKTGLLPLILPELSAMKGIEKQNNCAHKDNFVHSLKVLDKMAEHSPDLWLRWAALLHDIGKPAVKRYDENLGWTFHNHNFVGNKIVPKIFKRLKLPLGDPLKFVQLMVLLHMRPITLAEDNVTDSAVRRLLFDAGDNIDSLMTLCECDITSNNMEKVQRFSENFRLVRQKLVELEEKDRIRNFQPPVDGLEIMQTFNLPPCNIIGELKTQIKDAILDGVIPNDHDAAFEFLLKIAAEKGLKAQ
ncbi:MAG: CCA tRNA nucleotidyltransferase [Prevotellaceae bacterium]|jgi:poly(A) polymerase|nr:CCA tRNA nucleotidyltransferase [Prevotellaceae bacterium]